MYFTWYFIGCLFFIAITALCFPGWYIGWLLLVLLLLLWLVDMVMAKKQAKFTAVRKLPDPVYQNRKFQVEVVVASAAQYPVQLWFKDEPPFETSVDDCRGKLNIPATGEAQFSYRILAPKRGVFQFAALNLRFYGRLHLFSDQVKILPLQQELRVYPDLEKLMNSGLVRRVGSEASGLRRFKQLGVGGELAQLREYTRGDDYRKINWKVTARRGKIFVNEYEPERDQNVYLFLDTGRLLFDQVDEESSRLDHILDSALLLAFNILEYGDLVGALSFNRKIGSFIPAGKGSYHLQMLVGRLFATQAVMVESDYRGAFDFWQSKANKRSLLFIYTDLLDGESSKELISYLKILNRRHLVVCVLCRKSGLEKLAETIIVDEKTAFLKGTVLELLKERATLIRALSADGIHVLEVNPANIRQNVIEHYCYLKQRGLF